MRLLIKLQNIIPARIVEITMPAMHMMAGKEVVVTEMETYNNIKCIVDYYKESNTCNDKNMYNRFIRLLPVINGLLAEFNLAVMQSSIPTMDEQILTPVLLDIRS